MLTVLSWIGPTEMLQRVDGCPDQRGQDAGRDGAERFY